VRGQTAGNQFGDAFWLGRIEFGTSRAGFRPVVFYDVGWAGDRSNFSEPGRPMSGAGVGASLLDGLVRFDIARGIYPEKKFRANLYVEARF
jgi:hemolysin activation/secretion protein